MLAMTHESPPSDYVLTPLAAARLVGVHVDTIRRWARRGHLRGVRTPGGHRRFSEAEVRALLEQTEAGAA